MSQFKPSRQAYKPVRLSSFSSGALALEEPPSPDTGSVRDRPEALAETSAQPASSVERAALHFTMLFLFFRISFAHEFLTSKIHIDLHLLMLLGGASFLTALLTGKLLSAARDRIATLWLLFALCMFCATIFSSWRGGSLPLLFEYFRTALPLVLLIPAVAHTKQDIIKLVKTVGWAGIAVIALGFSTKTILDGRIVLSDASSIGDSNDYAAYLIFVFPVVLYFLYGINRNPFLKALGLVVIPGGVFQILSSGSRGGLVGIAATLLLVVIMGSPRVKIALLLGVPTLAMLAIPFIPGKAADRFASLFKSAAEDKTDATASSEARRRLLEQSLTLTMEHPVLGVGPGQFMDSESGLANASGVKGMWHQTHNTYTQVSSECGLPALLFFLAAIITTLKRLWRTTKAPDPVLAAIAQVVLISTFGFAVCVTFLSHAYDFPLIVTSGLAIAITRLVPRSNEDAGQERGVMAQRIPQAS